MRVGVRVDAGAAIGAGHVMRCLTLAEALRERGAHVRFVTRAHPGHLDALLPARGFEVASLGPATVAADPGAPHAWLGTGQEADAAATAVVLTDLAPLDWIVVDHYAIAAPWHRALRSAARRVMAIDDVADRQLDADLLLDQNFGASAERYAPVLDPRARTLLGPTYALVARPFRDAAQRRSPAITPPAGVRVLVSLGGADASDATSAVLRIAAPALRRARHVDVVIGRAHPAPERVAEAAAEVGAQLHVQTESMAQLLLRADLAIGAGGTSTWERMCVGVPSLVVPLADNQLPAIAALSRAGLVVALAGSWRSDGTLLPTLQRLVEDVSERRRIGEAGRRCVDGEGVGRVVSAMLEGG